MAQPFDVTLKEMLSQDARDFAAIFQLPALPAKVLNVDLSTLTAATDIALGFGEPLAEIVDINFQSGPDAGVPSRCHLYSAALNSVMEFPFARYSSCFGRRPISRRSTESSLIKAARAG